MKLKKSAYVILSLLLLSAAALTAEPLRISVLYFGNTAGSPELEWLEKGMTDMLLTDLSLSDAVNTIEREELEKIIAEQKFSNSGLTDDSTQIELGKMLAAELILTGSFIEAGGIIRIDTKLLDSETGSLRTAVKAEGPLQNIFEIETEIVKNIFKGLELEVPEGVEGSKASSVAAAESYYRGMLLFDNREYLKAVEYYKQAALTDPQYEKPRAGLEESYKFLKDFRKMRYQREINDLLAEAEVLRKRLAADEWVTYSEFLMDAYRQGITDNGQLNSTAEALGLFSGETPATCAWNLQNILQQTANLSIEYFEDHELADFAYSEIVNIAGDARAKYADDAFLPEIIYQELLVTYYSERWEESMVLCEELMLGYPEYRMMWAVEDFYENSIEELR